MADDIDIGYDIDPSGYLAGVNQIDQANQQLQRSLGNVVVSTSAMQKALGAITPSRATTAGMLLLATSAAQTEQRLSNLQAISTTTGASFAKLAGGVRTLAREMPIGDSSRQLIETFSKMGIGASGAEGKITDLAKATAQLGGATGDNFIDLAKGMTELSRATGNSQLDPKRFASLGDSLTTISAQSGSSATSILQFSKAIAPMAQSAGIGATGILGISSAFAKLGDDGIGASTAINKMLTDLSRSVREGTPELKTYAMIVGQTQEQFEALFKAKPAEALTQITEAIAKAGNDGPRLLERIGIEGVRGQRAITNLVASGGLRTGINEAIAGYGSGSTSKAAEAAFGGLADSLTELRESAKQVADAFGAPLLDPLTAFTKALKAPTDILGRIVSSGPVQTAMSVGGVAAGSLLAARSIMGPLSVLALGRQAATSGPGRAIFGGLARGRGMPADSRSARYGAMMTEAADAGTLGPINQRLFDFFEGVGGQFPYQPSTGRGFRDRLRTARNYGAGALGTYMNTVRTQFENASQNDPRLRNQTGGRRDFSFFDEASQAGSAARAAARGGGANEFQSMRAGMKAFNDVVGQATGNTAKLSSSFLGMSKAMAGFGVQVGKDAVRGGAGIMSRLGGFLGPTALLAGGISLAGFVSQRMQDQKEANAALPGQSISGTLDSYRESIGKATDTTKTFGSLTENLQMALANAAKVQGFGQTKAVTDQDVAAAQGSASKVTRQYIGSNSDVAAQIQSYAPNGISADELQAIKVDLLRTRTRGDVADILKLLPPDIEAGVRGAGSAAPTNFNAALAQTALAATNQPRGALGNFLMLGKDFNSLEGQNGFFSGSPFSPGGALYSNPLSDQSMQALNSVREGIGQQYSTQSTKFGANYASQERLKSMNEVLKKVYEAGNVEAFYELSKRFGADLGANPDQVWSANQFAQGGFDFGKVVAGQDPEFAKRLAELQRAGGATTGTGGISPQLQQSIYYSSIAPQSPFIAQAFNTQQNSPMSQAMAASLAAPGDIGKSTDAINAIVGAAQSAGKSMSDLAVEATKAANAVDEGSTEWLRLQRLSQQALVQMQHDISDRPQGQQQLAQYGYYSQIAGIRPTTEAQQQQVDQAKQQVQAIQDQMRQRLQARLQVQRQAEVQEQRANEDFQRTQLYAQQDYNTQVLRTLRNFGIQQEQAEHQYRVSRARAEQDFNVSRSRAIRDFNISAGRAEQDFQRTRLRAFRDFNKQMTRAAEDAARDLMDPYQRIQTSPTWDARNLVVNLQEQADRTKQQLEQLQQLRAKGLSGSAIDQLGLGKAENAQQVNNLFLDALNDPAVLKQINDVAKARATAASQLFTDESNKELERQKADFKQQLADQAQDYRISIQRSRADLAKGLADASTDLRKSLARGAEDFRYSMAQSRRQLNISLTDMATDLAKARSRSQDQLNTSLKRMREDIRMADQTINGSMADLAEQVNRAIHGKAVNWQRILKNDTATWVSDMQRNVIPKLNAVFSSFGVRSSGPANSGSSALADRTYGGGYHTGGEIQGYSPHPKADNILIRATGGEFMHNVAAVQHYGLSTMRALNEKRVPKERLMGFADGGWINPVAPTKPGFPWGHYPSGGYHPALDYPVRIGTPVHSPWTASIVEAGWSNTGYGKHIREWSANKIGTILGHLSQLYVKPGQQVRQGQVIGLSGSTGNSTGPHLHLEMRRDLYKQSTAFDFTKMGLAQGVSDIVSGIFAASSKAMITAAVNGAFQGMGDHPGPYNQLTTEAKKRAIAKLYDTGGILPHGGAAVNMSGKPERILTADQWTGISRLAGVGGLTMADGQGLRSAGGVHITVHNSGTTVYDSRNDFTGSTIQVMANNAKELVAELERKAVAGRITQTRGVNRSS